MASPEIVPTNVAASTYDTGGGADYTDIGAWEQDTDFTNINSGNEEASISGVSATRFEIGETLDFSPSSAQAECRGTNLARTKIYYRVTSGTPTSSDDITGATSGATCDVDSIDDTNAGVSFVLYAASGSHTDGVATISGAATVSASFRRGIDCQSGAEHNGDPNAGVRIKSSGDQYGWITEEYFFMQNIGYCGTANLSGTMYCILSNSPHQRFVNIIMDSADNTGSGATISLFCNSRDTHYIANSLFIDGKTDGVVAGLNSGDEAWIYNCTAYGNGADGFRGYSSTGDVYAKNNASCENGAQDYDNNFSTGSTENWSQDGTEPGTLGGSTLSSADFADPSSDDYHVASESSDLHDNAADLSSDSDWAFDEDWEGDARPASAWDVGCDQYTSAGQSHSVAGSISPTGAVANAKTLSVSASVSPTGAIVFRVDAIYAGAISPTGTLASRIDAILAGAVSPSGTVAFVVDQSLDGSITPTGALASTKAALLALAGVIDPSGGVAWQVQIDEDGSITPTGALVQTPQISFDGSVSPAGSLTVIKTILTTIVGAISPTGALTRALQRTLAASISPAGTLAQEPQFNVAGSITPTGVVASTSSVLLSIAGAITPTGDVGKSVLVNVAGAISPSGVVGRAVQIAVAGALSFVGTLANRAAVALAGAILPAADVSTALNVQYPSVVRIRDGAIARSKVTGGSIARASITDGSIGRSKITGGSIER